MDGDPTTRCKFRCTGVTTQPPGHGTKIELQAQYPTKDLDGYEHGEDHAFFNATPTGTLTMLVQNPYGAEFFEPGEFYYLDITKAPNPTKHVPQA